MKRLSLIVLGMLIAFQIAIPVNMIQRRENILRNGTLFKFKTEPIDPANPLQGRYVQLRFFNQEIPMEEASEYGIGGNTVPYAMIEKDPEGFACFSEVRLKKPEKGAYLETRQAQRGRLRKPREPRYATIKIPLDRYYMDEAKAPRPERLFREATRNTNCWVEVRILEGKAVIEDVFADGLSLRELAGKKSE